MQDNFSIRNWKNTVLHEDAFKEGIGELDVYGYQTQHFDICPGAQTLFKDILRGEFTDGVPSAKEEDKVIELAKLHDTLFALEKIALKNQGDAKTVFSKVIETASDIYELGTEIGLDQNSDLRYIQGHVEKVNDAARGTDLSEEDDIELEIPGDESTATIMKKSELKDYIKEQITNILTEATPEDVQNQADLNKELEKTADLKKSMGMNEDEEEAPAGDKKMQAKASKQDQIIKDFKRLQDQMKTHLELYKTSEAEENKKTALQMLKKLTPEFQAAKKEYEKLKGVKL